MALLTLTQYWTDEVARITPVLTKVRSDLAVLRNSLMTAQQAARDGSDAVRISGDDVEAVRRNLALIPMPADGDPLLLAMSDALVAWRVALAQQANVDLALQAARSAVAQAESREQALAAELGAAAASLATEKIRADERKLMVDALTSGALKNLAVDAAKALSDFEAAARGKIEGEFPSGSSAAKDLLKRVRDRRALVEESLNLAAAVQGAAFTAGSEALDIAQREFVQALAAVRKANEAAPRLATDTATLQRIAALAAPILTASQSQALKDAAKKSARESALLKLKAVDDKQRLMRVAQADYDKALNAALRSDPDKSQAVLDGGAIKTEADDLAARKQAWKDACDALKADPVEYKLLQSWFAAVPDTLWDELDAFDTAVARLTALKSPTPAELTDALATKEDLLAKALRSARLGQRKQAQAAMALLRTDVASAAEQSTASARARALSRMALGI